MTINSFIFEEILVTGTVSNVSKAIRLEIEKLKLAGAEGILVVPIEKMIL